MPGKSGFDLLQALSDGERTHTLFIVLTIIALTAYAMAEDRERSKEAGMTGFLTKPLRSQDLYACIEALPAVPGRVEET